MNVVDLQQHAIALIKEHVKYIADQGWGWPGCSSFSGISQINIPLINGTKIPKITTEEEYVIVLHEIGHCVIYDSIREPLWKIKDKQLNLEGWKEEKRAWYWVWRNSKAWTSLMSNQCKKALVSYINSSGFAVNLNINPREVDVFIKHLINK